MSLTNQAHLFDLEKDKVYLNGAAYSPLLKSVVAAGIESVQLKARPYHIVPKIHFFDKVDEVRVLIQQLINANDKDEVAMIPAASYGLAIVAANLHRWPNIGRKKKILLIDQEFPNDFYAFEKVCSTLSLAIETLTMSENYNESIFKRLNEEVAMIVLPHVHWITGYKFDVVNIGKLCREHGIMLVIDGTQSVGALPLDVQIVQPDALICASYKWLLGPYGQGFVYLSPFFDEGVPVEESWINRIESDNFAGLLAYKTKYRPKAQRYNVGEYSQFIQIPMLHKALTQILEWGPANIQSYCRSITEDTIQSLVKAGVTLASPNERVNHLFALEFDNMEQATKVYNALSEHHIYTSLRGSRIRISPYLYNDVDDLEKLAKVVIDSI
jgi:selenocysteine lyase/cysteine desulfurase